MDRQQIAVRLAIKALGLDFNLKTFDDRLTLQKAVYLAQATGVHLGYHYHWYLYGPYSPSLTRDAFAIDQDIAQGLDDSASWTLDEQSKARLEKLKDLIPAGDAHARATRLELLASVLFLATNGQAERTDVAGMAATLNLFKKDFSEDEISGALEELEKYGLIAA